MCADHFIVLYTHILSISTANNYAIYATNQIYISSHSQCRYEQWRYFISYIYSRPARQDSRMHPAAGEKMEETVGHR